MSFLLGGLISGALGLFGSSKAANAQKDASEAQIALQKDIYEDTTARFQPFYDQGLGFSDAYNYELFGGPAPTVNGQEYQGFQATPGYQFQLQEGLDAIDNSAAARGMLFSGDTMKAAQSYGQGLANQEYNTYLNRLATGAQSGQAAAGNMANAGANYAQMGSNALGNYGNAAAAGWIGGTNALTGALNNTMGLMNYQNAQSGGQANLMSTPWAAPGFFD